MGNPYLKAVGLTTVFTFILILIQLVIAGYKPGWLYVHQWYLLFYFYLITLLSLWIVERSASKDQEKLAKGYFSAMMLRLFVSVIIAVIIIYFDRTNSTIFALNFLILYLLYLGFEIYYLISIVQARLNSE
jgi:hypothetical protein